MIDRDLDRPAFKQLADLLRTRIASGKLAPGRRLPSETALSQEHGLSRNTVRRAVGILQTEGLVVVDPPHGTFVRELGEMTTVTLGPGDAVTYTGVGNVTITRADGATETYPAGSVRVVSQ